MPKRRTIKDSEDESEHEIELDNNKVSKRENQNKRRRKSYSDSPEKSTQNENDGYENENGGQFEGLPMSQMHFSQQAPEVSQPALPPNPGEVRNLSIISEVTKERIITDLSRLLLFKALTGQPISRLPAIKQVLPEDLQSTRISSAVFHQASKRLHDVFGFELRRIPEYMENDRNFPAKYKDRYYVLNRVQDDMTGTHSKALHSVHDDGAVERGLLMLILSFCYCKGEVKDGTRWISANALYRLLHSVDENIPADAPFLGSKKNRSEVFSARRSSTPTSCAPGLSHTPDVDSLLKKFVQMDYLREKKGDKNATASGLDEGVDMFYAMGPRAAMEIGRKQIVYFCAEILDEQPDPTMLSEIVQDGGDEGQDQESEVDQSTQNAEE